MASTIEVDAMRRALALAEQSVTPTHPNPRVGAVIMDANGVVVGAGHHRGAGQPHAEVEALALAGAAARGATAVVTLEPCCHRGRTGPCTEALLDAGVVRVVYGQSDPNPTASGGAQVLGAAGVSVESGVLLGEALALNHLWSLAIERRRPFVTWKVASTVDGRVAAMDGSSRWITGDEARAEVHALRSEVQAVMVGVGTVLADDPQLSARDADGALSARQPVGVVVGMREIPEAARVREGPHGVVHLRTHDPHEVLDRLFELDVHHVLLEGGPTLAGAFVSADLVDRAMGYIAPALLGEGPGLVTGLGITSIADARRFSFDDVALVGSDLRWTAQLQAPTPLSSVTQEGTT